MILNAAGYSSVKWQKHYIDKDEDLEIKEENDDDD